MTRYPEPDPMTGLPGAVIGALTGLVYGFVLWVLIAWLFEQIWPAVIGWCAAGFAVVGWFNGNVVFELTLGSVVIGFTVRETYVNRAWSQANASEIQKQE